jgi:hypothetical protein
MQPLRRVDDPLSFMFQYGAAGPALRRLAFAPRRCVSAGWLQSSASLDVNFVGSRSLRAGYGPNHHLTSEQRKRSPVGLGDGHRRQCGRGAVRTSQWQELRHIFAAQLDLGGKGLWAVVMGKEEDKEASAHCHREAR